MDKTESSLNDDGSLFSSEYESRTASDSIKKRRKTQHFIINVPVQQLKKIGNYDGISSLSKETQQFVGITTIHGPLRIYRGHGIHRFLWFIATVLCVTFCVWQVHSLIYNYVTKPTASQIVFILPDEGMALPYVTICNYNNVRKSYINQINDTINGTFSDEILDYMASSYLEPQIIWANANESDALVIGQNLMDNFTSEYDNNFTMNEFFMEAGPICNKTLKICAFAGTIFDCCKYVKEILTDMGKCFQIDVKKIESLQTKVQLQSGVSNGLQIFANYLQEEEIDDIYYRGPFKYFDRYYNKNSKSSTDPYGIFAQSIETGFRLYIHSELENPFMSTEGITTSPGTRVYSAIYPTRYVSLPEKKWGHCIEDWPNELKKDSEYSSQKCKAMCRAKFYDNHCGCSPFVYNIDGAFPVCTAFDVYNCIEKIQNVTGSNDFPKPNCDYCKVECDRWVYHTFNSYGQEFSDGALQWIKRQFKNETTIHIKNNYVAMNVYYRDMTYTMHQEIQSTSFTQTVSNIGGTAGMCLGISFISMIEIIVYLWKTTWIIISKNRRDHLIKKRLQEEEREKNLEMTLKHINSKKNLDETIDEDKPLTFRRIANSLRRKVTQVFPNRKESGQEANNENYLNHRLYGNGRAGFDKPEYVELRVDSRQLAQLLRDNRSPSIRQRSNSCPRESCIGPIISMASIPVQFIPIIGNRSELENIYSDEPSRIIKKRIPSISIQSTKSSSTIEEDGKERNNTAFY